MNRPAMVARVLGARGSIPVPGAAAAGFGGNTACVAVTGACGSLVILDAGTGIRALAPDVAPGAPFHAELFLTHFHWDHILGLPFFAPMRSGAARLRLHAPRQGTLDASLLLGAMAAPAFFPLPIDTLGARVEFRDITDDPVRCGDMVVRSARVHHPSHTRGYRLECNGATLCYVPDNEIVDGADGPVLALAHDADVLIHDAMFTPREYPARAGWGHSPWDRAVRLAATAGVRMLCLFHHDPDRTDRALRRIGHRAAALARRLDAHLCVEVAAEGDVISLVPGEHPLLQRPASPAVTRPVEGAAAAR